MRGLRLTVTALVAALHCFALDATVAIDSGRIQGVIASGVTAFKGVPYAAPPVGALRWKPPQPVAHWDTVRSATDYGSPCPQPPILERMWGIRYEKQSEDCLTLNVWTAARAAQERRPVMLWIHGGDFIAGSSGGPAATAASTDGSVLARQGVVVVSLNYRLGPFGFLALPALSHESPQHASGNYGMLDQVAALEWVKRNIGAFGGDSGNVTIFGESAGAGSVCWLMASPLARGLFQRAIAESPVVFIGAVPLTGAEQSGVKVFGDDLAALRAKSTTAIMDAAKFQDDVFFGSGTYWGPIVDGSAIPQDPATVFRDGRQAPVALIAGTNADEGTVFTTAFVYSNVLAYRALLTQRYSSLSSTVFALYPAYFNPQVRPAMTRLLTDSMFLTSARRMVRAQASVNAATYLYHFTRVSPYARLYSLGSYHGAEIPYVFGTVDLVNALIPGAYDNQDRDLARSMSAAWVRFASTGNPNGAGFPGWSAYMTVADPHLEFGDTIRPGAALHAKAVDTFTAFYEKLTPAR
ncbi:MAG TPA: carboxylesterase family protein [Bryobacteraceae bacterium]|nr:carboxylesterase family protein [Bryobacteraceae bacterium]